MKSNIKLFLVDCDGVLTDGGMYYLNSGEEIKKFNTRDGMAFKLLKEKNIKTGIITGEKTNIVKRRFEKLKLDYLFMGAENKLEVVKELKKELKINWENILYIGDDINDLELLKKVGISACPSDAEKEILNVCKYISKKEGGNGVVRDVFNHYFNRNEELDFNDVFKLFDIPGIGLKVNTFSFFKHCMKDNFFNAHIMIKMLAIDCYFGKNDYGWKWYNEMQKKRVADNPLIPKHMAYHEKEFKELIESFEKNGYLEEKPIIVNKDFLFIDGSHRLALALYFGIKEVPISIDKNYFDIESKDYSFDWFDKHGMEFVRQNAMEKYNEICEKYEGK